MIVYIVILMAVVALNTTMLYLSFRSGDVDMFIVSLTFMVLVQLANMTVIKGMFDEQQANSGRSPQGGVVSSPLQP